jgi:hypothetical protein
VGEVKNNNQLLTGASKVGGGWQESIDDHITTMAGDDERQERWQMMRAATKRARTVKAMVTAMRVLGNKEDEGRKGQWHQ